MFAFVFYQFLSTVRNLALIFSIEPAPNPVSLNLTEDM